MKKTAILILAAGESSRMGSPKQLLPYQNTTLLGWAIEQAKNSITTDVFCVLGANAVQVQQSIEKKNIEIIINKDFQNGLSSSIVAGINHLKAKKFDSVLIMLADQPNVNTDYLNKLITASEEKNNNIVASCYPKKTGVPAVFSKQYFNQLLQLKGDKGAKNLLNNSSNKIIIIKDDNLKDIDTKADYNNLINTVTK